MGSHLSKSGPFPPPQMLRAAEATPMLPMPALGVDSMPGVGASTAVVAPYPWVPVGKHPPPSPPPGPPPPENVAAASLAAATRAALAKASSQERAPPVSDSSVTCDGSCANPIGSYSAHQQREPGLVLQEDTCMEMASTSLVRTDASVTMSSFSKSRGRSCSHRRAHHLRHRHSKMLDLPPPKSSFPSMLPPTAVTSTGARRWTPLQQRPLQSRKRGWQRRQRIAHMAKARRTGKLAVTAAAVVSPAKVVPTRWSQICKRPGSSTHCQMVACGGAPPTLPVGS